MLKTYDLVDPAGVTLHSVPEPDFGPDVNFHSAMVVSHSCETRIVDCGRMSGQWVLSQ